MLAIGWEHWSIARAVCQCCTKEVSSGLVSVFIQTRANPDSANPDSEYYYLNLILNGQNVSSAEIRPEIVKSLNQPLSIHILNDKSDVVGTVIILWSTLSLSLFDISFTPPYHFQESSSFRLQPDSISISASTSFSHYLILVTAEGSIWVFNCHKSRSSAQIPMSSKRRRLRSCQDRAVVSMAYSEQLSLLVLLTQNQQLVLFRLTLQEMTNFLDSDVASEEPTPIESIPSFSVIRVVGFLITFVGIYRIGFSGNRLVMGHGDGGLFFITLTQIETSFRASELISISFQSSNDRIRFDGAVEEIYGLADGVGFCVRWQSRGAAVFASSSMTCVYSTYSTEPVINIFVNCHAFVYASISGVCRIDLARIPSRTSSTLLGRDRILFWDKQHQHYQELNIPQLSLESSDDFVRTVAISPNGKSTAVGTARSFALHRKSIFKWNVWTGKPYQVLNWIGNHFVAVGVGNQFIVYAVSATNTTAPAHIITCKSQILTADFDIFTGLLLISQGAGLQSLYVLRVQGRDRFYSVDSEVYMVDSDLARFTITSHHLYDVHLDAHAFDRRLMWTYTRHAQPAENKVSSLQGWMWSLLLEGNDSECVLVPGVQITILELNMSGDLIAHQFIYEDQIENQGAVLVSSNIERFWINRLHPDQAFPEFYIWVYSSASRLLHLLVVNVGMDTDRIQVLLPNDFRSSLGLNRFERSLLVATLEADSDPVEIWPESGSIASVVPVHTRCNRHVLQLVHIKQICYLPLLLLDQISQGRPDAASAMLAPFHDSRYLLPTLEFLLHYSIDSECDNNDETGLELMCPMSSVLSFLKGYDLFLQCVVRCARKTDFSHWGRLFPLAGTPLELFQECLRKRDLTTGSHFLMVLQRTEGSLVAHQNAIRLLDALLHSNSNLDQQTIKLALQLMRFIYMSKERNTSNYDRGTELQRRASDASSTALERTRSGPLPERRPSTALDSHAHSTGHKDRRTSWIEGLVEWFTE